jgi:hypothetical protein
MSPNSSDLRQEKKQMDRYLLIEIGSEGIAFETAQFDFYLTWLGLLVATVAVAVIRTRKAIKTKKNK